MIFKRIFIADFMSYEVQCCLHGPAVRTRDVLFDLSTEILAAYIFVFGQFRPVINIYSFVHFL